MTPAAQAGGTPRRVVVTGASGGLGSAVARRFLGDKAVVINLDLRPAPEDLLAAPGFHGITTDIADPTSVRDAFTAVDRHFANAAPDVFVHCAAISKASHFLDIPIDDFDRIVATNVRGTFLCCQEAARRMRAARRGHIVTVTSVAADQAWAGEFVYCATKAAQRSMTQGMAIEMAPFGVLVNAIGPGLIEHKSASMAATRDQGEVMQHDLDRTPLGRFGDPDELALAIHYLASVTWMTGQTLYVDGGFLASGLAYFGQARDQLLKR
jgi:NAD(P)-dependent dehydrogenase (short-subunit alcohol dehydrogenase family)